METVLLTTLQLAKRLGLSPITIQIWRSQGLGIPFVKQGPRVFYRLADVQTYERRNIESLSAWLLGGDRPLPEMEAVVRAANLPLQKIRQRIGSLKDFDIEIDNGDSSLAPNQAVGLDLPQPELIEPIKQPADSDKQTQFDQDQAFHQSQPLFAADENAAVTDGPFAGLEAIYQNPDAESRSMSLLDMLSKTVAMRIDAVGLRKTG